MRLVWIVGAVLVIAPAVYAGTIVDPGHVYTNKTGATNLVILVSTARDCEGAQNEVRGLRVAA